MVNEDWVRVELECVAHGNPQPLISWQRRDGAQIQVYRVKMVNEDWVRAEQEGSAHANPNL
jgi:hypothetical protein